MTTDLADARRAELAASLAAVRARVDAACKVAGRDPSEVAILPVTKTFPASDVALLAGLGCTAAGENRDQEAKAKAAEVAALGVVPLPAWHMIGQVQRKKARSVVQWASVVESVDRLALVEALARASEDAGRALAVCIQVSLDPAADNPTGSDGPEGDGGRGGARPADVAALADAIAAVPALTLAGLMAVAPYPGSPGDPDAAFARLATVAERLRADHPQARLLSAGMSGDLESAITHGATQVRIGGAILGNRPLVQ